MEPQIYTDEHRFTLIVETIVKMLAPSPFQHTFCY